MKSAGAGNSDIDISRRMAEFDATGSTDGFASKTSPFTILEDRTEADLIPVRCTGRYLRFTEPSPQIFLMQRPRGSNPILGHRSTSSTHSQCWVGFRTIQPAKDRARDQTTPQCSRPASKRQAAHG